MREHEIAVIGMSGRFPGAPDLDAYWRLVVTGGCAVRVHDRTELLASGVPRSLADDPDYVPADGFLEDADAFDAEFFGVSEREAALTDPQHRLLLECAWAAMEDSGYPPRATSLSVGCFATAGMSLYAGDRMSSYLTEAVLPDADLVEGAPVPMISIANRPDYLATRVAYQLGLRGPALTVQTACSSSLVAVHLAVRSLLAGECDLALAGGAAVHVPLKTGYLYQPGGLLSRTGVCRPLDARADGTVGGSGVGVVVLRRLADALAADDPVRAVITGSAVNNDGADKAGFTAPGLRGQREVITAAHAMTGTDTATLGLVEMHGTATRLGDPLEVRALRLALGSGPDAAPCALGAVKANIGHLDTTAGIAGLIKTVLAVEHDVIPPVANYRELNPEIDLGGSPLYVPTEAAPWPDGAPRRAAVSAFGAGGTNAHVVVEQASSRPARSGGGPRLIAVSARDTRALRSSARRLAEHLRTRRPDLADVSLTTLAARTPLARVLSVVATSPEEAADRLDRAAEGELDRGRPVPTRPRPVVLLLPGQGGEVWPFLRRSLKCDPGFREAFACLGEPVLAELATAEDDPRRKTAEWLQPALVATGLALALALRRSGVVPAAVLGHSLGELTAAAVAGVFDPRTAVALAARRGALMDRLAEPGLMLAVAVGARDAEQVIRAERARGVSVAVVNAPTAVVLSGHSSDIHRLAMVWRGRGVRTAVLPTTHAFHSALMEPVVAEFRAAVAGVTTHRDHIPVLSTVTGDGGADLTDPDHWGRHLRLPVRFADAVCSSAIPADAVFVDLGVGGVLAEFAAVNRAEAETRVVRLERADTAPPVQRLLLGLRGHGTTPDWSATGLTEAGRRVPLPTYPFAPTRHWPVPSGGSSVRHAAARLMAVEWRTEPRPRRAGAPAQRPVLLVGRGGEAAAAAIRTEFPASRAVADWDRILARGPSVAGEALAAELSEADGLIDLTALAHLGADWTALRSAMAVATALTHAGRPVWTAVATAGATAVDGPGIPEQAAVWGFVRALRTEQPESTLRLVDLGADGDAGGLGAELVSAGGGEVVLRGGLRLTPLLVEAEPGAALLDQPLDTVLVAGGGGGVGTHITRLLARRGARRVVLAGRTRPVTPPTAPPGCAVVFEQADVADPIDVDRLDEVLGGSRLSLIVVAAGVLRDGLAGRVTEDDLHAVLAPKLRAAELLGGLAARRDCPVLAVSSLAAILGSPGQAAYSAANLAMEASAARWRANGVRMVTLAFGPWRGVGMSAALDGRSGPRPLPPEAWLDVLARVPADGTAHYALPDPVTVSGHAPRTPIPVDLAAEVWASVSVTDTADRWERAVADATVETLVIDVVAAVAGRSPDTVAPDAPFVDLGLDSLTGLRLRRELMALSGRELSTTLVYDHPTPRLLAAHLTPRPKQVVDQGPIAALAKEIVMARAALGTSHRGREDRRP